MFTASLAGRPIRLLLTAAFLLAGGAGPYGAHACPMHGKDAKTADSAASAGVLHRGAGDADGSTAAASGPEAGTRTCLCLGNCHATAATPVHGSVRSAARASADVALGALSPLPDHLVSGPRHLLFELHRPNAPPLTS